MQFALVVIDGILHTFEQLADSFRLAEDFSHVFLRAAVRLGFDLPHLPLQTAAEVLFSADDFFLLAMVILTSIFRAGLGSLVA